MKKIIYSLGLVAMLASCSDNYTDWATPQSTAQEDAASVTLSIANAAPIDFGTLATDSVQIFVPTVVDFNTTTSSTYKADMSYDGKTVTLNADSQGRVLSGAFKTAVETLYGKAPATRDIALTVTGFASTGSSVTVKNTGTATAKVTVVAPFIDSAYYLVGDMFDWNKDAVVAFTQVGSGSVYDNPEFTIIFETKADNQYWKIIPQTNYDGNFWAEGETGVVGVAVDGDSSPTGNLTTTNPGAGKIEKAGYHRITINMMTYTYKVEDLDFAEFIYETGNNTGWSNGLAMFGPNFDGKYYGAFYLDGAFKFKPNSDNWEGDWEYNGEGVLDANGKDNIPAPATGHYFVTVDLGAMTYSLKPFTEMHIVGDAVGDWNVGKIMTWNSANHTWVATGVTLGNGNIKFKDEDSNWAGVNLGGNLDKLVQNADNIAVTPGTYDIVLHMENGDRAPYAELIAETAK